MFNFDFFFTFADIDTIEAANRLLSKEVELAIAMAQSRNLHGICRRKSDKRGVSFVHGKLALSIIPGLNFINDLADGEYSSIADTGHHFEVAILEDGEVMQDEYQDVDVEFIVDAFQIICNADKTGRVDLDELLDAWDESHYRRSDISF